MPCSSTHLYVTARPNTATKLMDLVQQFQQKPREGIPAQLLKLWEPGAESVIVNGPEISKLASITSHPALRYILYATIPHQDENLSSIDWLMAACHISWPNTWPLPRLTSTDNHIVLQLWKQLQDDQEFQNTPERARLQIIQQIPVRTWNLEGLYSP